MSHAEGGKALKLAAHRLLESRRRDLVTRCRRALLTHLLKHGPATIDVVREEVTIPPGVNPVLVGAVPGLLAAKGIIRRVGYTPTGRTRAHARPVAVWELANVPAALDWLARNPEPTDDNVSKNS